MSKVTELPYQSPRCVICGRDLPRGRRQKCYICRPIKPKLPVQETVFVEHERWPYTINDCCALSWAYGISYGHVIQILEQGLPWPPQKRPLVWPEGSVHANK